MSSGKRKQPIRIVEYLLDKFDQIDIRSWKRFSDRDEEYHVRLFHHLEALRSIHKNELHDALHPAKATAKKAGSWYRIVDFRYSNEFLSSKGSMRKRGRFNIGEDLDPRQYPPFPALYIAESYTTAYSERFGGSPGASTTGLKGHELTLRDPPSFTNVKLSFELSNIFDLSKASNLHEFSKVVSKFGMPDDLKKLGKSIGTPLPYLIRQAGQLRKILLAQDWSLYPVQYGIPSNPQVFGRTLRDAGFEGVIYPSTKGTAKCIAVFVENLSGSESCIELRDPAPASVAHTRLNSENWQELSLT